MLIVKKSDNKSTNIFYELFNFISIKDFIYNKKNENLIIYYSYIINNKY